MKTTQPSPDQPNQSHKEQMDPQPPLPPASANDRGGESINPPTATPAPAHPSNSPAIPQTGSIPTEEETPSQGSPSRSEFGAPDSASPRLKSTLERCHRLMHGGQLHPPYHASEAPLQSNAVSEPPKSEPERRSDAVAGCDERDPQAAPVKNNPDHSSGEGSNHSSPKPTNPRARRNA